MEAYNALLSYSIIQKFTIKIPNWISVHYKCPLIMNDIYDYPIFSNTILKITWPAMQAPKDKY